MLARTASRWCVQLRSVLASRHSSGVTSASPISTDDAHSLPAVSAQPRRTPEGSVSKGRTK
jgi:hypothetical protein